MTNTNTDRISLREAAFSKLAFAAAAAYLTVKYDESSPAAIAAYAAFDAAKKLVTEIQYTEQYLADTTPKCTSCDVKLTQFDLDGSLSELGLSAYEAICAHCYAVEVEN